ncbi:MAG: CRISPR-associated protein Csx11 [Candidatus Freyarchaeum deiterrae]
MSEEELLKKLEDGRPFILLAEIGAYLHDLGKVRKEFVIEGKSKGHNFRSVLPQDLQDTLIKIEVDVCGERTTLMDFIEKHHPEQEIGGKQNDCDIPPIIRLLYAGWNGYDGIDSGLDKGATEKQNENNVYIATAFGYEPDENKVEDVAALKKELYNIVKGALSSYETDNDVVKLRKAIIKDTKNYYLKLLGETRRPANDVTLWDHSYSVATLFKCVVAKNVVDCSSASFDPLDFNWRILSINMDILGILAKGIKVGDMLGYKAEIDNVLDSVKILIEEIYPLGNELYRDASGIYFLIPDINFKTVILNWLKDIEPELMPAIIVEEMPVTNLPSSNYRFDCPNQQGNIPQNIQFIREHIEKNKKEFIKKLLPEARRAAIQEMSYPTSSDRFFSDKFEGDWNTKEICSICMLRPVEENSEGCEHCLKRRRSTAINWIKNPERTIWLDEVSDHNDRAALLVGCFVMDDWLDGLFIKTMTLKTNPHTTKNASPARIRRVWETTLKFIKESIFANILAKFSYSEIINDLELRRKRINFRIIPNPDIPQLATLDLNLKGVTFSPVCVDKNNDTFVTTINLQILGRWGKTPEEIASYMNDKKIKIKVDGSRKDAKISECKVCDDKFQNYAPFIQIYDSPDQFMALVPAYHALDIAEKIVEEYKIQFSKVRDRLPFHIGIIAFHRKTPLYVTMDAGRRLVEAFKREGKTINARIDYIQDVMDQRFGYKVKELTLQVDPSFSYVPYKRKISYSTGDPNQEDEWYTYFRIKGANPNRGNYSFDYTGNGNYVVHVKGLLVNDCVNIESSHFNLFYIENAADRFKVDENLRPLDDIHRLNEIWEKIKEKMSSKKWSISQVFSFWQEVKKRYEEYGSDAVWESFTKSALRNILKIVPESDEEKELLQAAKDGILYLCLNWHLQVRKIKP